jgi:hypothetical protein
MLILRCRSVKAQQEVGWVTIFVGVWLFWDNARRLKNEEQVNIKRDFGVKKCIIMQFLSRESRKVHYSALFGDGKIGGKRPKIEALNAVPKFREQRRGVPKCRPEVSSRSVGRRRKAEVRGGVLSYELRWRDDTDSSRAGCYPQG